MHVAWRIVFGCMMLYTAIALVYDLRWKNSPIA